MKFRFFVEEGVSYLSFEVSEKEREVLDSRCQSLGLKLGPITKPCQLVSEETFKCWKGSDREIFLGSILAEGPMPVHLADGINDPLFQNDTVNMAILRIQIPPNSPTRFVLQKGFVTPNMIRWFTAALAEAMRRLYESLVDAEVTITFSVSKAKR